MYVSFVHQADGRARPFRRADTGVPMSFILAATQHFNCILRRGSAHPGEPRRHIEPWLVHALSGAELLPPARKRAIGSGFKWENGSDRSDLRQAASRS